MSKYSIILTKEIDGLAFNNSLWKGKESVEIFSPVTVLTGNNGTGKTAILNAIALGCGVDLGFTSLSESKHDGYQYPRCLETDISKFGTIKNSYQPDEVFFNSPLAHIKGNSTVETELDLFRIFMGWNKSHGEGLTNLSNRHFTLCGKFMYDNKDKCCINLMDEPEAGLSLEAIHDMVDCLRKISIYCTNKNGTARMSMIITTQNPELVVALVNNGAMRIDLGGWKNGDPFAKYF